MMDERGGAQQDRSLLYKTAFESANDVIIFYHYDANDPGGPRIIYANRKFAEETGYSVEEAVGRYSSLLFGADTNLRAIEANRILLARGEPSVTEICKYTKQGAKVWMEVSVYPLKDTSGNFTFWISIERNITARREMEDHMRLLRLALESASDMVVINAVDADTSGAWKIVYVNSAFERMTGWDRSELDTLDKVFGASPDREQSERVRIDVLSGKTVRVQNVFYRRNGEPFWVEGVIEPVLGEEDRPIHSITIYREIAQPPTEAARPKVLQSLGVNGAGPTADSG